MSDRVITLVDLDRQIEALKAKEQDLKRESRRISDEIMALRPRLYALVDLRKGFAASADAAK